MRYQVACALIALAEAIKRTIPTHRCAVDGKTCAMGPCPPRHCRDRVARDEVDENLRRQHKALIADEAALDARQPRCIVCGSCGETCPPTAYECGTTAEINAHGDELYERVQRGALCQLAPSTVERNSRHRNIA